MEATQYEVGKFYFIPVMSGFSVKLIPVQVVRKLKRKITFKFVCKTLDGKFKFDTVDRHYHFSTFHKMEVARASSDIWSIIPSAWSDKVAPKPAHWEEAEAEEKKGAR